MSEDKELVEDWRKQFIGLVLENYNNSIQLVLSRFDRFENDKYIDKDANLLYQGFLLAKRSQPSVVLPKPVDMYDSGGTWEGRYYHDKTIYNALTDAGIKYTIGE